MEGMNLDAQEWLAVREFLSENWSLFQETAAKFLSEEEIEALGDRVDG